MIYLPLDKLTERRMQTLSLDQQRQAEGTRDAVPEVTPPLETVEARRDRGTR
jgi:hypothetical protein